jgi:hypothetical protein
MVLSEEREAERVKALPVMQLLAIAQPVTQQPRSHCADRSGIG